ncbi:hypothetical protein [Zooshikella harenae]|uniref:Integrase n=1 Tax=Zooshikella harenae TaxID=2827238 RepID=A0ABS5ZJG1_9GAMM|nr:hypothetical protein [Zooshikella harenae]MBU2713127.1 hypothetical protein [Zooshikella harenae]
MNSLSVCVAKLHLKRVKITGQVVLIKPARPDAPKGLQTKGLKGKPMSKLEYGLLFYYQPV